MNSALRPMSTAEVLDRTFHLYRNNFVLFVGISMVAYILRLVMPLAMLGVFGAAYTWNRKPVFINLTKK